MEEKLLWLSSQAVVRGAGILFRRSNPRQEGLLHLISQGADPPQHTQCLCCLGCSTRARAELLKLIFWDAKRAPHSSFQAGGDWISNWQWWGVGPVSPAQRGCAASPEEEQHKLLFPLLLSAEKGHGRCYLERAVVIPSVYLGTLLLRLLIKLLR